MDKSELEGFALEQYYEQYKAILLQTGYLTFISDYNFDAELYQIGYPNEEVRYSMTEQIMKLVTYN